MDNEMDRKNLIAMKLLHYFITEKNYNPIILQGAEDEIWLENMDGEYKIVRIVSNHIINEEQLNFDIFKTKHIVKKIKKKTFSFSMNVLSIFTDLDDEVKVESGKNMDCASIYDEKDISKYNFILESYPDICNKMEFTEEGFQLFMKITSDINKKNKEDAVKVDEVFKRKTPYITIGLILINTIIFILTAFFDYQNYFIDKYSVWGEAVVKNGEIFRLITGTFIHGNVMHFILNMYALYVVGSQMESFLGKTKYTIVYFFSALTGSLFSIVLNDVRSIGASGAIFGLLGSLLYFGYHYRVYLGSVIKSQIIPIIAINLLFGFLANGSIDNYAHVGGLIGGALITSALGVKYKSTKVEQINGAIVSLLLVAFMFFIAFNYVNFSWLVKKKMIN